MTNKVSNFSAGQCLTCGSRDLATYVNEPRRPIFAGVDGFIGCRNCGKWEKRKTVTTAKGIHDDSKWEVTESGDAPP